MAAAHRRAPGATIRVKGGLATRPTLPQMAFRAGSQGSVRGHDYGVQRGDAFWAGSGLRFDLVLGGSR